SRSLADVELIYYAFRIFCCTEDRIAGERSPAQAKELAMPEVATPGRGAHGFPEPFVEALLARYAREVGQPAPVTGEVERILGRPARTYAQWVADHAAAFRNEQEQSGATD